MERGTEVRISTVNGLIPELIRGKRGLVVDVRREPLGGKFGSTTVCGVEVEGARYEVNSFDLYRLTPRPPLTFAEVSSVGLDRAMLWHPGGLDEWTVSDWACAMAGEAGEVCNAVKKLRRIETGAQQTKGPRTREEAVAEIAKEIGDTYLYLDLLAQRLGIDIAEAIRSTFNRVSEREGFPQRL